MAGTSNPRFEGLGVDIIGAVGPRNGNFRVELDY